MVQCVLHSSIVLAWCFNERRDLYADRVLSLMPESRVHVPCIWSVEIASTFLKQKQLGRIDDVQTKRLFSAITAFSIKVDTNTHSSAFENIYELADAAGLSIYDAAYVELALRKELPLATLNSVMKAAMQHLDIDLFALESNDSQAKIKTQATPLIA